MNDHKLRSYWLRPGIPGTDELWKGLEAFAATFNHTIHRQFPYIVYEKDGKPIGFVMILDKPVAISAWHPDSDHRTVIEAIKRGTAWAETQFGEAFTGVQLDHKTFTLEVMDKLGFDRCRIELYKSKG